MCAASASGRATSSYSLSKSDLRDFEATIRIIDGNVPVTTVWASRGKVARAEPVSALYEQGKVHHIGTFPKLEDQMCAFTTCLVSHI
jgi:phage terminase large subunit-like protein